MLLGLKLLGGCHDLEGLVGYLFSSGKQDFPMIVSIWGGGWLYTVD